MTDIWKMQFAALDRLTFFLIDSGGKITNGNLSQKTEGNKATMEISGWLDTQTAPQLGEALSGLEDSITSLVFDFTNLEYISSAGLRQVIVAYKKNGSKGWI